MHIDDILGSSSDRFFGSRYRSVRPVVEKFESVPLGEEETRFEARAAVTTPALWSVKNSGAQKQHLSTIDLIVLASQVTHNLQEASGSLIGRLPKRLTIRAASAPVEENLDEIHLVGRAHRGGNGLERVEAGIHGFKITVYFSEQENKRPSPKLWREEISLLRPVDVNNVHLDNESATADVVVQDEEGLTGVDAFVSTLQLGQALLYRLDKLERNETNTLWMRQTAIDFATPSEVRHPAPLWVALKGTNRIPRDGGLWRTATVVGQLDAATVSCAVVHKLPSRIAEEVLA